LGASALSGGDAAARRSPEAETAGAEAGESLRLAESAPPTEWSPGTKTLRSGTAARSTALRSQRARAEAWLLWTHAELRPPGPLPAAESLSAAKSWPGTETLSTTPSAETFRTLALPWSDAASRGTRSEGPGAE